MSDLIEQLRKWAVFGYGFEASRMMLNAAAALEAATAREAELVAQVEALREALKRIADDCAAYDATDGDAWSDGYKEGMIDASDIARTALEAKP